MSAAVYVSNIMVPESSRGYGADKVVTPAKVVKIEMKIDLADIMQHFGEKAARSKGKRTGALAGRIKIKVLKEIS